MTTMTNILMNALFFILPSLFVFWLAAKIYYRNPNNRQHLIATRILIFLCMLNIGSYFEFLSSAYSANGSIVLFGTVPLLYIIDGLIVQFVLAIFAGQRLRSSRLIPLIRWFPLSFYVLCTVPVHLFLNIDFSIFFILSVSFLFLNKLLQIVLLIVSRVRYRGAANERNKASILLAGLLLSLLWTLVFALANAYGAIPGYYNSMGMVFFGLAIHYIVVKYDFLPPYEKRFKVLYQLSPYGILFVQSNGRVEDCNTTAANLLGYSKSELQSKFVDQLFSSPLGNDTESVRNLECKMITKSGASKYCVIETEMLDVDPHKQTFLVFRDVDEQKKRDLQIIDMAYTDSLTGLYNRLHFRQQLEHTLENIGQGRFALMLFDLDGFKKINDTYGHHVGDESLKWVAERMRSVLDSDDVLARLGGDEFTALIPSFKDTCELTERSERLLNAISMPFEYNGIQLSLSASIGISVYPVNGEHPDKLMKAADKAMYQSKQSGRRTYSIAP